MKRKFSLKTVLAVICITMFATSFLSYVLSSNGVGAGRDLYFDDLPSTASYVINTDDTYIWATRYDGYVAYGGSANRGGVDGTNSSDVINACNGDFSYYSKGTIFVKAGYYVNMGNVTVGPGVSLVGESASGMIPGAPASNSATHFGFVAGSSLIMENRSSIRYLTLTVLGGVGEDSYVLVLKDAIRCSVQSVAVWGKVLLEATDFDCNYNNFDNLYILGALEFESMSTFTASVNLFVGLRINTPVTLSNSIYMHGEVTANVFHQPYLTSGVANYTGIILDKDGKGLCDHNVFYDLFLDGSQSGSNQTGIRIIDGDYNRFYISDTVWGDSFGTLWVDSTGTNYYDWYENAPVDSTASYVLFKDGSDTCMQNETTGTVTWRSTNSSAVINAGHGNLTSGGTLFIKDATYNCNTIINVTNTDVAIVLAPNAILNFTSSSYYGVELYADRTSIRGGKIRGMGASPPSGGAYYVGIKGDYCRVEGVTFDSFYYGGLGSAVAVVTYGSYPTIIKNTINADSVNQSYGIICYWQNTTLNPHSPADGVYGGLITDNIIRNVDLNGIFLRSIDVQNNGTNVNDFKIINNHIENSGDLDIEVQSVDGCLIQGNTLRGGNDGIGVSSESEDVSIIANVITEKGGEAIVVFTLGQTADFSARVISIKNNEISYCAMAIRCDNAIYSLDIVGNKIRNQTSAVLGDGNIQVLHGDFVKINNNDIINSTEYGIYVAAFSDMGNVQIHDNMVANSGQAENVKQTGIACASSGAYVIRELSIQDNHCSDNQASKTQQYGIGISGNNHNASIIGNRISYATVTGIYMQDADNSTIFNNVIRECANALDLETSSEYTWVGSNDLRFNTASMDTQGTNTQFEVNYWHDGTRDNSPP